MERFKDETSTTQILWKRNASLQLPSQTGKKEKKNLSNLLKQDFCCRHNELVNTHSLTACAAPHQSLTTCKQHAD